MSVIERLQLIVDGIKEISDNQIVILEALEDNKGKLDRLLASGGEKSGMGSVHAEYPNRSADNVGVIDSELPEVRIHSPGFDDYKPPVEATTNFALPMTGKYQWYRLVDQDGKVRKCENLGCDAFLKYDKDKKSYEHWKYDPNTGHGGFVADRCEGVFQN